MYKDLRYGNTTLQVFKAVETNCKLLSPLFISTISLLTSTMKDISLYIIATAPPLAIVSFVLES
ncbi:hypothetical protein A1I_02215 [Rickettsia bellii OSU 85-389]|uniref:hypothetical protein n=1 Tax=Rickettsia bellii TaxID=33990 RepID=UPI0000DB0E49|nr:hypothetical protein [Rickettsia bellii]ABV78821.1 hypothetical protein A1I_02215 [Rickettsia bellii OSU 85-389]